MKTPTKNQIDDAIEKYGFRVPYDGSDKFYDEVAMKHFEAGINWVLNNLKTKS